MLSQTKLAFTATALSIVFAGASVVYNFKSANELKLAENMMNIEHKRSVKVESIHTTEKLVNKAIFNHRTEEFFKRATSLATSTDNKLSARTTDDEMFGTPESYEAVQSLAGMAGEMSISKVNMTFNEQSDGIVYGAGDVEINFLEMEDDVANAQVKTITTTFTGIVTLEKHRGKWRVANLRLGTIKPGENANDTIY